MRGYFRLIERWRYRLLLAILLATIVLQPLLQGSMLGQAIVVLAYGAILAGGVYATRPQPWLSALCSVLVFILVGLNWYFLYSGPGELAVVLVAVSLLLGVFTASRTLITLVSAPATDADALAGAIFGYFLLALVWALLLSRSAADRQYPGQLRFFLQHRSQARPDWQSKAVRYIDLAECHTPEARRRTASGPHSRQERTHAEPLSSRS